MAGYRQIHTKIWKDDYIIELTPEEKLLFIYLFSNELTSISGIYKIPTRVIANETGLSFEYVQTTLEKFEQGGKISREDGVIWIVNMQQYHSNASPTTMKKVMADIEKIPNGTLKKRYMKVYQGIYTPPIPHPYPNTEVEVEEELKAEKEIEKEIEEEKSDIDSISLRASFESITKLESPRDPTSWNISLQAMKNKGVTESIMRQAVTELSEKNYKIVGPKSIESACAIILAKRKREHTPRSSEGEFAEYINH